MEKIKQIVGKRIRFLRKNKKFSQEYLADSAGLDRTYISSVEGGYRNISIVSLLKIVSVFEITLVEFFSDSEFNFYLTNGGQNFEDLSN